MTSQVSAPRLWRVPCRANVRPVTEEEDAWETTGVLIAAHTAEEAVEVARAKGWIPDGGTSTPLEEVSIDGRLFRVVLEPVRAA